MANKPKILFVTGTDTGVGKTAIACLLCRQARQSGLRVNVMKPFASGSWDDARRLKKAAGTQAPLGQITPVFYRTPAATWAAALREKRPWKWRDVDAAFARAQKNCDVLIVEGIGGALVPLNETCTVADLIARWNIPAIVVARWGLGTLNHTLLTLEALKQRKIRVAGLIFNQTTPGKMGFVEKTNRLFFEKSGVPVLGGIRYAAKTSAVLNHLYRK